MEGTTRLILFILLVTLSLVTGHHFTFSKEAYLEVLKNQQVIETYTDPSKSPEIQLQNANDLHEWIQAPRNNEGMKENVLYLVPKKNTRKTAILPEISIDNKSPEQLSSITMFFKALSEDRDATVYGTLVIGFKENKKSPAHQTVFVIDMFSPPETEEDTNYAKDVAVYLDPFPHYAMKRIFKKETFNWKLSHIQKVIDGRITKVLGTGNLPDNITMYGLKPIIVDKKQLIEYVSVSNSNGKIRCIKKDEGSTSGSTDEKAGGESIGALIGEES